MAILQYITDQRNKIIVGAASGIGLIVAAAVGVSLTTPAYQVRNHVGQVVWQNNLQGDQSQSGYLLVGSGTQKVRIQNGSITGTHLNIASTISGVGLTDCDADAQALSWDASTKQFVCGDDDSGGAGGGISVTDADLRYVNTFGDTMTGNLVIANNKNLQVANTISGVTLKILGTASGNIIHAEKSLSSSGALFTKSGAYIDGTTLVVQSGNNRVGIGTATPSAALDVTNGTNSMKFDPATATTTISGPATTLSQMPRTNYLFNGDADAALSYLTYDHNNQALAFDAWHNGTSWVSSHAGSNFSLYHVADELVIGYNAGTTKGSTFVGGFDLANGARFSNDGKLGLGGAPGSAKLYVNGNTGLGTTTPKAKLDVLGAISGTTLTISKNGSFSGALNVVGNIISRNTISGTTLFHGGIPSGRALCQKTTGAIGYCSSVIGVGGDCTCN